MSDDNTLLEAYDRTPLQEACDRVEQWKRDYYALLNQTTELRAKHHELQQRSDRQDIIIDTLCKRVQGHDKT